jgi:hypothetical protein
MPQPLPVEAACRGGIHRFIRMKGLTGAESPGNLGLATPIETG